LGGPPLLLSKKKELEVLDLGLIYIFLKGKIKCTWKKIFVKHEFHTRKENNGRSSVKYEIT